MQTKRFIRNILTLLVLSLAPVTYAFAHSYDLKKKEAVPLNNIIEDVQQVKAVFIGESHDQLAHHQAQLQLITALHEAGAEISIGLEMFRQDGQEDLNKWTDGKLNEIEFSKIFLQHWGRWSMYRDIFVYARDQKIPMIGLNISRDIVNQVARKGFSSLSAKQKSRLPLARCNISPEYRAFIRRAFGGHDIDQKAFENFCEAQMLWDAYMAKTLKDYLTANPKRIIVVLAGKGHSWKHGIPSQLDRLGDYSYRVLLPEVPGSTDLQTMNYDDADYLLMGVEQGPLH